MIKQAFAAIAILGASPVAAGTITYVANFGGPTLDSSLTFQGVQFDPLATPTYSVGGGVLTLQEPTGRPSEANVYTNFAITGDFKATVTADLSNLGTRGFAFSAYQQQGGLPISTTAFPGGNIFQSGPFNTQSYISDPAGGVMYMGGAPGGPTVIYDIVRSGNTLSTYLNGALFNTGSYTTAIPTQFLISLCGSSCYSTTAPGEDNIARVLDFRITYFGETRGGGVPEPSAWALLILGFGLTGAAMRRRRVSVRHAIA